MDSSSSKVGLPLRSLFPILGSLLLVFATEMEALRRSEIGGAAVAFSWIELLAAQRSLSWLLFAVSCASSLFHILLSGLDSVLVA
ncbi:hypothetical protein BHM03_00007293 [Ensete ventricosum]|nr:hypothetical protein BHM03_00007293 [Ensete ventricosum]